eukprot:symbB.v1.2.013495.t1/scaffold959.1/size148843/4
MQNQRFRRSQSSLDATDAVSTPGILPLDTIEVSTGCARLCHVVPRAACKSCWRKSLIMLCALRAQSLFSNDFTRRALERWHATRSHKVTRHISDWPGLFSRSFGH